MWPPAREPPFPTFEYDRNVWGGGASAASSMFLGPAVGGRIALPSTGLRRRSTIAFAAGRCAAHRSFAPGVVLGQQRPNGSTLRFAQPKLAVIIRALPARFGLKSQTDSQLNTLIVWSLEHASPHAVEIRPADLAERQKRIGIGALGQCLFRELPELDTRPQCNLHNGSEHGLRCTHNVMRGE